MTTRRTMFGVIVGGALGCARSDWVESTLVTVDVAGHWTDRPGPPVGDGGRAMPHWDCYLDEVDCGLMYCRSLRARSSVG